jgi:hypothetical protein
LKILKQNALALGNFRENPKAPTYVLRIDTHRNLSLTKKRG